MHTTSYLQPTNKEISYYLTADKTINEEFSYKVLERKKTAKSKPYYIVDLQKLNDFPISGKLLLYDASDSLIVNNIYLSPLSVSKIAEVHNPEEFDFHKYYFYQGIHGRALPIGLTIFLGKEENILQRMKSNISAKIEKSFSKDKGMALALFLGKKSLLDINQDKLSEMGLIHLFAVSGLHVGIIYITILTILNLFLGMNRARLSASIILLFYGYLCSWTPSVFRTVLIISIYNFTLSTQRKVSFLQLISLTLFIITIINPLQLFSVGLHLSLTAFISLWIASRRFIPYFYRLNKKYKLPKLLLRVGEYLIYSLSVVIFIAPLSAYYFNIISVNAIITNVIATPIVALMLNTILISLFIPQAFILQNYLSEAFSLLNFIFSKLIDLSSYLPLFTRKITLTSWELLSVMVIGVVLFTHFKKHKVKKIIFISGTSLLLILKITGIFVNYQDQVICFDAGKADCSYLEFSDRQNLLIDTGSSKQYPNIINSSVLPFLRKRHIYSLDAVIITHPHEDHYGGLSLLAQHIKIKEIIIHQTALQDETFSNIISKLEANNKVLVLHDTTTIWDGRVRFLHPDKCYDSNNFNNNSLVAMVNYDSYKLLFTGDIEEEAENLLVKQYGKELSADFLKIPHHGSITSSTEAFLELVKAKKYFIPAGNQDRTKFPNPVVLERLEDRDIEVNIGADTGALVMKIKH